MQNLRLTKKLNACQLLFCLTPFRIIIVSSVNSHLIVILRPVMIRDFIAL